MPLPAGTRIGPYEIVAPLGQGGMGEVYRATDKHLGRAAAIKVLPETFALDVERIARFEREARTLASLNHPNIAQVFGLEKGEGGLALAMELVEGQTLAERLERGPIPVDEASAIGRQVAQALEAAHDQGIVHRDLKPANIKVRDDGTVKVLDFGLAKAIESGSGAGGRASGVGRTLAAEPTITTPAMTAVGLIMGTAAYMSPEQARGRPVDRRADVWAFGCVLYEMLTGKRAFAGDDISDVLVAVLRDEPNLSSLPGDTPAHIRTLLRRCLQKDLRNRLPHIGAARLELSEAREGDVAAIPATARSSPIERALWALGAAAVTGLLAFIMRPLPPALAEAPTVVFDIQPPPGTRFPGANNAPRFAVSPDGTSVAYQARLGSSSALFRRRLDGPTGQVVAGTESANDLSIQAPLWSPDSRFLAFFDEPAQKLKKADLAANTISVLCDAPGNQGSGAWNAQGVIIFSSSATSGVWTVPATGGTTTPVTVLDKARGETAHLFPQFLPDHHRFVYLASGPNPAVFVGSLEGGPPVKLFDSSTAVIVASPKALLSVQGDALVAQHFDFATLKPIGDPTPVADGILRTPAGRVAASASTTGVLVYARGGSDTALGMAHWVDRTGRSLDLPSIPGGVGWIRLSADGRYAAYSLGRPNGTSEVWLYDLVHEIPTRLSATTITSLGAVFSADGTRVSYVSDNADGQSLLEQPLSGAGSPRTVAKVPPNDLLTLNDWTPDGRAVLVTSNRTGYRGLYLLSLAGDDALAPFIIGTGSRLHGAISPDGRWLAYSSSESGQPQIFVQSYPDPGRRKWPVSKPSTVFPRWRKDGRELFFLEPAGGRFYSVTVTAGPEPQFGQQTLLFEAPGITAASGLGPPYDVSSDGQRFLVVEPRANTNIPITVVVNWDRQTTR